MLFTLCTKDHGIDSRFYQYLSGSVINFIALWYNRSDPQFLKYLASVSILTYISFAINSGDKFYLKDDSTLLVIGYIATSYLAGCYLSIDFEVTAIS